MIGRFLLFLFCLLSSSAAIDRDIDTHPFLTNDISDSLSSFAEDILGSHINHDNNVEPQRKLLAPFECGQVIKTYDIDEIKAMISSYVATPELFETISSQMKFSVQFRRVCASCASIIQSDLIDKKMSKNKEFLKYCGEDAHGSGTLHSGTVMLPVILDDDGSYSIIPAKTLTPWLQFRGLSIANTDSFNVWLNTPQFLPISHINNQLIASSSGLVSVGITNDSMLVWR